MAHYFKRFLHFFDIKITKFPILLKNDLFVRLNI